MASPYGGRGQGLRDRQGLFGSGGGNGPGEVHLTMDPSWDLDSEVDGLRANIGRMKGVRRNNTRSLTPHTQHQQEGNGCTRRPKEKEKRNRANDPRLSLRREKKV